MGNNKTQAMDKAGHKAEADIRAEQWRELTPAQQLKELDARLGVGVGAKKQRARLAALIAKENG